MARRLSALAGGGHQRGDDAAVWVGLGMPLHPQREGSARNLEGLGHAVIHRPRAHHKALPHRGNSLMVV